MREFKSSSKSINYDNLWQAYGFDPECPVVAVFWDSNAAVDFVLHDERTLYVASYAVPSFTPTWWNQYPSLGGQHGKTQRIPAS